MSSSGNLFTIKFENIAEPTPVNLSEQKREFIFLLDRSGSMYGARI